MLNLIASFPGKSPATAVPFFQAPPGTSPPGGRDTFVPAEAPPSPASPASDTHPESCSCPENRSTLSNVAGVAGAVVGAAVGLVTGPIIHPIFMSWVHAGSPGQEHLVARDVVLGPVEGLFTGPWMGAHVGYELASWAVEGR